MNKKIFLKMYNTAKSNKFIKEITIGVARVSSWVFFLVYALLIFTLFLDKNDKLYMVIVIPALTIAVNMLARKTLKRPRPFDELNIKPLLPHSNVYSFPSNHCASALIIAAAVYYVNPYAGMWVAMMAVVTGLSRIAAGLHYPVDVLAGYAVAIVFAFAGFIWG